MNERYIYKVHNLRYSYALYNNCKNTKFKITIGLQIKSLHRLKALLNRRVFNPDFKMSTVLLLRREEGILFQRSGLLS